MGLIRWLMEWLGWRPEPASLDHLVRDRPSNSEPPAAVTCEPNPPAVVVSQHPHRATSPRPAERVRLTPNRYDPSQYRPDDKQPVLETEGIAPYRYARYGSRTGRYLDLSQDGDAARLQVFGLPILQTPEELADWIGIPLNRVAWLIHRFSNGRPELESAAHYHYRWIRKRSGGWRLIESPKSVLKQVQTRILRDLLDQVPAHATAHGFTRGRSILTNARPHAGHNVVLKFDLSNFYASVGFARVVAIFRSLGYSREVAIWLGSLTTSAIPGNLKFQDQGPYALFPYLRRHLPQGAPTSPALANLSAFALDIRLSGLARSFGATYTRYADDLTFSGPKELNRALKTLIPLIVQIVGQERFQMHPGKRRILRAHQRQTVAGVVVNQRPNVARSDFDRLKAILTNCIRSGPETQNRHGVANFHQHLQGRIAHVAMLNPARGERLKELFQAIKWTD